MRNVVMLTVAAPEHLPFYWPLDTLKRHSDTQYNDIQHNVIQHNVTQHNVVQHNDIQHNNK
jgi:hypothetical protein